MDTALIANPHDGLAPLGEPESFLSAGTEVRADRAWTPGDIADFGAPPVQPRQDRLAQWQLRLLDLSVRNPLLNFRDTKGALRLAYPDAVSLASALSKGKRLCLGPMPALLTAPALEAASALTDGSGTPGNTAPDVSARALERNKVLVDIDAPNLERQAVGLYRQARTALQEGGANTLHIAIGFLRWHRDPREGRTFRAPLILIPVTLERTGARGSLRLVARDDEPVFNGTLLEMLRQDFGLTIPELGEGLPRMATGAPDVDRIWAIVRDAVRQCEGFAVEDDVVLGHVSFAKHLMWADLKERAETLRETSVVRHLIDSPRARFPSDVRFPDPAAVDQLYSPSDLLVPLPADGSQMAAIAAADQGKDFVLIGPPGTGKSQTIANLIAHMMGTGRSVLFVSEKIAALEVVHRRLDSVGLGHFCLQLHSNRARKLDVLKQLGMADQAVREPQATPEEQDADRLTKVRDRLNGLSQKLQTRHANGLSLHTAIGIALRNEDLARSVTMSWSYPDLHDEAMLEAMTEAAQGLETAASAVDDLADSALTRVRQENWSPEWERDLMGAAEAVTRAIKEARQVCATPLETMGIDLDTITVRDLPAITELSQVVEEARDAGLACMVGADGTERLAALKTAVEHLRAFRAAWESLSVPYDPMAWRVLDGEALLRRWLDAARAGWLKGALIRHGIRSEMRKVGGAKGPPAFLHDAPALARLRKHGAMLDKLDALLAPLTSWDGHWTRIEDVESLSDLGQRLQDALDDLASSPTETAAWCEKVRDYLGREPAEARAWHSVPKTFAPLETAFATLRSACQDFDRARVGSGEATESLEGETLPKLQEIAVGIIARRGDLKAWCVWRRARATAIAHDLLPVIDAVETGRLAPSRVRDGFRAAYCTWWVAATLALDEMLSTGSMPSQESTIEMFRDLDAAVRDQTARDIGARLRGIACDQDQEATHAQWAVLNRELKKKARHKPLRQLLLETGDVVRRLTPCLMMSPLSVAQYLPPEMDRFDVVIVDEASQITVSDAIGALARGRQVIVAGDPMQLPPTDFFNRKECDEGEDGSDPEQDITLESILDEMRACSIPECVLDLHYRSRQESLIAFSNRRYYDGRLTTFPANRVDDTGITWVRPRGFYARGAARHNEGEARAVVAEVLRRLTHSDPAERTRSIGVVSFNAQQQTLIEDLLDDARRRQPEIEWAFSGQEVVEPLFVKNLETVQGDERDVILFSVTYGPDEDGRVTLNLGPLNRPGGERRLNVALTRARSELVVFSSLAPEDIDPSRVSARGVADLRDFLAFAARGVTTRATTQCKGNARGDSFEDAVRLALEGLGWTVHSGIGRSGDRIDLAVVHPDAPGTYLAGILGDGMTRHRGTTAAERYIIRPDVMRGLGWRIIQSCALEWWNGPTRAAERLHQALAGWLLQDRTRPTERSSAAKEAVSLQKTQAPSGGIVVPVPIAETVLPTKDGLRRHG